jgi:hypothetical protein
MTLTTPTTELPVLAREGLVCLDAAATSQTPAETVFTRNATEALNLVAQGWGRATCMPAT